MVDKIIGVSDASCRYVIEREYAPSERVERLYNAVDPDFYLPTPDRRSRDRVRFVSTGRLVPVKNYQMLIESFLPVAAAHPRASLVIAGDGPLRDVLRARIDALGLADRVTLLGFCGQVRELLDEADAFVIPSLAEGMCISLAEALARGLPAIATTAGGAGELVAPLGAGWAQPPDMPARWTAAMLRLIEVGPEERAKLGQAARVRAMAFHPDQHRLQLEAIYSSLASPHRSQP
jgi:glycosyltransferase involved in cell wall biosynthesis